MCPKPETIKELVRLATEITGLSGSDGERFISSVTVYLDAFDRWITEPNVGPNLSPELKPLLEELSNLHREILFRASEYQGLLAGELRDVHRRAQGLRAYLDHLPSRITVAGKREG